MENPTTNETYLKPRYSPLRSLPPRLRRAGRPAQHRRHSRRRLWLGQRRLLRRAAGLKTPHLDRLAREGRRFTQAYAPGSVCSPTRYGMMTGRYFWRTSVKDGACSRATRRSISRPTGSRWRRLCRGQGYTTGAFGKWHLGLQSGVARTDWNEALKPGPLAVGFDHFYGLAANPWNGPHTFIENERLTGRIPGQLVASARPPRAPRPRHLKPSGGPHHGDAHRRVTGGLMENRADPSFVYFAPERGCTSPSRRIPGSAAARTRNMATSSGARLERGPGFSPRSTDPAGRPHPRPLFTSDNGGVVNRNNEHAAAALDAGLPINGRLRGGKHDVWEGGYARPFPHRWPGEVPDGTVSAQVISLTDVLASFARILQ